MSSAGAYKSKLQAYNSSITKESGSIKEGVEENVRAPQLNIDVSSVSCIIHNESFNLQMSRGTHNSVED